MRKKTLYPLCLFFRTPQTAPFLPPRPLLQLSVRQLGWIKAATSAREKEENLNSRVHPSFRDFSFGFQREEEIEGAALVIVQDLVCNFDGDDDCNDVARVYTLPAGRACLSSIQFPYVNVDDAHWDAWKACAFFRSNQPGPSCQSVKRERGALFFLGAKGKDFSQSKMRDPSCCLWEFSPRWAYTNVYTCWAIALSSKVFLISFFLSFWWGPWWWEGESCVWAPIGLRGLETSVSWPMRDVICLTCCSFIEMNVEDEDALIHHPSVGGIFSLTYEKDVFHHGLKTVGCKMGGGGGDGLHFLVDPPPRCKSTHPLPKRKEKRFVWLFNSTPPKWMGPASLSSISCCKK